MILLVKNLILLQISFCLSHSKNCLIIGKTNSGKINILMNLIAQNSIYQKIYLY